MAIVLLVDDDADILAGFERMLRRESYDVRVAQSASEALQLLQAETIDVVVSDEQMPGMRGSDFLALVCERYPQVIRMLLTGNPSIDAAARAINGGRVFRFLQKPLPREDFLAAIRQALDERARANTGARLIEAAQNHLAAFGAKPAPVVTTEVPQADGFPGLTPTEIESISPRELEVLEALLDGFRTPQIAKRLFISPHTVRNHLRSMFQKLNVHSQQELIERAKG